MLNKLLLRAVIFMCGGVALLFASNDKAYSQGLEAEATVEENIPRENPLIVKYINADLDTIDKAFAKADPLKIELQMQDRAFPNGGGSVKCSGNQRGS